MADIRPDRMDETTATADEIAALESAGYFAIDERPRTLTGFDLVNALRIGYALGRRDQHQEHEATDARPRIVDPEQTRRGDRA